MASRQESGRIVQREDLQRGNRWPRQDLMMPTQCSVCVCVCLRVRGGINYTVCAGFTSGYMQCDEVWTPYSSTGTDA